MALERIFTLPAFKYQYSKTKNAAKHKRQIVKMEEDYLYIIKE